MNQTDSKPHWTIIALGVIVSGAIIYSFFSEKEPSRPKRRNSSSSGTKRKLPARALAREELKAVRKREVGVGNPIRNQSSPKRSKTKLSSDSRSEKYSSSVIEETEKVNVTSTRPEILSSSDLAINKYPPHYYSLSKKAQWKFRKNLKNETICK